MPAVLLDIAGVHDCKWAASWDRSSCCSPWLTSWPRVRFSVRCLHSLLPGRSRKPNHLLRGARPPLPPPPPPWRARRVAPTQPQAVWGANIMRILASYNWYTSNNQTEYVLLAVAFFLHLLFAFSLRCILLLLFAFSSRCILFAFAVCVFLCLLQCLN